jgi:hypothetical protein
MSGHHPLGLTCRLPWASRVAHDVEESPGAGHGLMDDRAPNAMPRTFAATGVWAHTAYRERWARDPRHRLVTLFDADLKESP